MSVSRSEQLYIDDIILSCERITTYIDGLDRSAFTQDQRTIDAVCRNLMIVGEAAKRLSPATKVQISTIEWRKIAGLRDMLAHAYFGIDTEIVWNACTTNIPELTAALRKFGRNGE